MGAWSRVEEGGKRGDLNSVEKGLLLPQELVLTITHAQVEVEGEEHFELEGVHLLGWDSSNLCVEFVVVVDVIEIFGGQKDGRDEQTMNS